MDNLLVAIWYCGIEGHWLRGTYAAHERDQIEANVDSITPPELRIFDTFTTLGGRDSLRIIPLNEVLETAAKHEKQYARQNRSKK